MTFQTEFEFEPARRPRAGYRTRVAGTEAMTRSNPYDLGLDRNQAVSFKDNSALGSHIGWKFK